MKKGILALALVVALGATGYQLAEARMGGGYGPGAGGGVGYCDGPGSGPGCANLDEAALAAREAFHAATAELRKQIAVKQSLLQAAINSPTPDEARVATLTEELFELRAQMRNQAQEAGVRGGGRGGCGGGRGAGPRS